MDEYDKIPSFDKALSQMSGALIELDLERKARFVHVSVLEYLTDESHQEQPLDSVSNLVKERSLAQRPCASCCLAYLLYSIPAEPLGGGPQVFADRDSQKIRYPFLEYSVQYWDFHFSEFLLELSPVLSQECEFSIKLASDFFFGQENPHGMDRSMLCLWGSPSNLLKLATTNRWLPICCQDSHFYVGTGSD